MLFRHTLLYLPAQVIGPLFQLISVIAWTHVTSESTLGVITLVTATHELLQTVFLAWWSQFALRFLGSFQGKEGLDRFYRTENAVLLASVVIQSVIAITILWTTISPDAPAVLSVAVVGYVVTRSFNLYIAERARVRHEIAVYSIQQITGPALGFVLGLLLIHVFGEMPEWPIAGYAVAQFAAVAVVLPMTAFGWSVGPVDRTIIRQALKYGVPLIVGGGLGWVSLNASRFIVSHMWGLASAGLFAVGYGLGQRAATMAAMLVTASAFPIAVRRMEEHGSKAATLQLMDNGALLAAILFPSVAGVFALRTEIVHVLIAGPFQAVTLAILPLAALAGAVRNFRAHFGDQIFLLHRRTPVTVAINGIEAVITVVAGIILIEKWGPIGGAAASVIAATVAAAASFAAGLSIFKLRLPLAHLVRIAAATAAMMAVLHFLKGNETWVALAVHVAVGAAVYVIVLIALYGPTLLNRRPQGPAVQLVDRGG